MKHKIATLEGALLDAAVAKALGYEWRIDDETIVYVKGRLRDPQEEMAFCPSMYWDHGGPIIERERIMTRAPLPEDAASKWPGQWEAVFNGARPTPGYHHYSGPTPLIAAMRAYVASRFGEEVELP